MKVPKNGKMIFGKQQEGHGRALTSTSATTGGTESSLLALRVIGSDNVTSSTAEEIREKLFYDSVSLRKQLDACSYGQTTIQPYDNMTSTGIDIDRGVAEITINNTITGSTKEEIAYAVLTKSRSLLGSDDQFDHIFVCLVRCAQRWSLSMLFFECPFMVFVYSHIFCFLQPPGTNENWISYSKDSTWRKTSLFE